MNKIYCFSLLFFISIIGSSQNFKTGTFKVFESQRYNPNDEQDKTEWLKIDRTFIIKQDFIIFYYGTTDELRLNFKYVKQINSEKYLSHQLRGLSGTAEYITVTFSCPKNENADSFYILNVCPEGTFTKQALRFKMRFVK
ncbi:MAG: hypothetical protein ABSE72_05725 [Bacteroidales bacterium]|jgi:hypothetical protein